MAKDQILLFVYGTLKKDHAAHHFLEHAKFIGKCSAPGLLLHLTAYPALIPHEEMRCFGEVYEVTEEQLARTDAYETQAYERRRVSLSLGWSWTYYLRVPPQLTDKTMVVKRGHWCGGVIDRQSYGDALNDAHILRSHQNQLSYIAPGATAPTALREAEVAEALANNEFKPGATGADGIIQRLHQTDPLPQPIGVPSNPLGTNHTHHADCWCKTCDPDGTKRKNSTRSWPEPRKEAPKKPAFNYEDTGPGLGVM